jgi:GT2 family glycosyltransferase
VKISVVLATYRRPELLREQLEALTGQEDDGPWELIVADNGSNDGTREVVESYRERVPELRFVVADEVACAAYVMNAGVAEATGEAFAFLNDDDVVAPGWLAGMRAGLERHDAVAARVDWTSLNPDWTIGARGQAQRQGLQTWWAGAGPPFSAGGTIGVRRAAHDAIGGFDESFAASEDVDYCWRLAFAGYELVHLTEAVVRLRNRTTIRGIYRQARAWGEGDVRLYRKHRARLPAFRRRLVRGLAGWAGTAMLLARSRGKADLANVARHAGWRIGLVRGSLRHRVLMLSD